MGGIQKRKASSAKNKQGHRRMKVKHYRKDIDLIHEDLKEENSTKLLNQDINEDLPGLGQYYCVPCAKYYVNQNQLEVHNKTKSHKKQLKTLKEKPYTIEDSVMYSK